MEPGSSPQSGHVIRAIDPTGASLAVIGLVPPQYSSSSAGDHGRSPVSFALTFLQRTMSNPALSHVIEPASRPLDGTLVPPSDKSITHRALFFGALNRGTTTILNPSGSADCRSTRALLEALGYAIGDREGIVIDGAVRSAHAPELELDCGNSGTTARLALGFLTGERGSFTLTGDDSLMRRPMERVAAPLRLLGARVETSEGRLPARIVAAREIPGSPAHGVINVASAQVHTALVLAGLRSRAGVALSRTADMRDHTLRLLAHLAPTAIHTDLCTPRYRPAVDVIRPVPLEHDATIHIPGDLSAAAFFVTAALLVPGSHLVIEQVGLNPTRTAFLAALRAMGAHVSWSVTEEDPEPIGRIEVEYTPRLAPVELGEDAGTISVAEMMDELPLLALVASRAEGRSTVSGAAELRVKESDRIAATGAVLRALGIAIEESEDGFTVAGPQRIHPAGRIDHHGDHRLCMLAAVAALASDVPVTVPAPEAAAVSYPGFWRDLARFTTITGES
jgi:3-phosphoshikimate 1-carboxyvinyltransferase